MRGVTNADNIGGTVGSDTKPIKIVNGQAVAVSYDVITTQGGTFEHNKHIDFPVDPYNIPLRIAGRNDGNNIYLMSVADNNGTNLISFYVTWDTTNGARLCAVRRKADGTYSYPVVVG